MRAGFKSDCARCAVDTCLSETYRMTSSVDQRSHPLTRQFYSLMCITLIGGRSTSQGLSPVKSSWLVEHFKSLRQSSDPVMYCAIFEW